MKTLWAELNSPDVAIYWPALILWLCFAAVAALIVHVTLFDDQSPAVKYTVAALTCPDQRDARPDAETDPEVSDNATDFRYLLTRTRVAMATSSLDVQQTAETWDRR